MFYSLLKKHVLQSKKYLSQTKKGQRIDCDLLSTQIASLANLGSSHINAGIEARRWGTAHETIVPYEAFETKDGRWITIGAGKKLLDHYQKYRPFWSSK